MCRRTTQRIAWAQYRFEKSFGRLGIRQTLAGGAGGPIVCSACRGRTTIRMLEQSGGLCAQCWRVKKAPMRDVMKRTRKVKYPLARREQAMGEEKQAKEIQGLRQQVESLNARVEALEGGGAAPEPVDPGPVPEEPEGDVTQ